ncbi:MAG: alpha/beta hydrolase [Pseudomonadota bacterium]
MANNIKKHARYFLPIFILIFTCGLLSCTYYSRRLIFQPYKIYPIPKFSDSVKHLDRFWIKTEQGNVEGWILKGDGVNEKQPGPSVIIAHGNRELIDYYLDRVKAYQQMGYTVLLGEYRGYGRSAGSPTRERIAADYKKFYDYLASLPFVDNKRIVFHGRSLGGSVLSELSRERTAAAIIVESSFTSIKDISGAPDFLISDNYDTVSALSDYKGPVLIIHGIKDDVISVKYAREMNKSIPQAKLILYEFGHSDGPPNWEKYWQDITEFLQAISK